MREILFRGKAIDIGEWVEGYPVLYPDGTVVVCKAHQRNENVDPETVGQYTGLRDKDGQMIFEWDILKYGSITKALTVEWLPSEGKFMGIGSGCLDASGFKNWEVAGNIFDNPELLETAN